MIIAQVCLRLATIKGHSKMCSFITQHNATDVTSFEGACNWNAECRNVHQSCCPWIGCSILYHKSSPKAFQRTWQYIQPASQLQTMCNHTSQDLHIQHIHLQNHLRPATSCCNNRHKLSESVSRKLICMLVILIGVSTWLQFIVVTYLSGQMLTFDRV